MTTTLAFLRAINLGAQRKFAKADIVSATEAAGFIDVATYINTGNVRFETRMRSRARIEAALEAAYAERTGFAVPTIVLTADELRQVLADAESMDADPAATHYVSLLKHEPDVALAAELEALADDAVAVRVSSRTVHLVMVDPYHQARLTNVQVEKRLGVATNRNLRVLRAVAEKWC